MAFFRKITNVKTLQERLIYVRELRGLSQGELASRAGCSQSTIGNIESGARDSLRNLVIVARVLQCSADWLYDGKGPKPTQEQLTYTAPNATAILASDNVVTAPSLAADKTRHEVLQLLAQLDQASQEEWLSDLRGFVRGRRPHQNGQALPMAGKK